MTRPRITDCQPVRPDMRRPYRLPTQGCIKWQVTAQAEAVDAKRQSSEAALKYVVYGGGASGVMLYGISLLAGRFGTGYLPDVASEACPPDALDRLLCATCIVAMRDLDVTIYRSPEPVARPSRHVVPVAADDE